LGGVRLYCSADECQSHFNAQWDAFGNAWGKYNPQFIFAEGNRLRLVITHGPHTQDSLDCRVDLSTGIVQCGTLTLWQDGTNRKYSGTMNANCLRVVDDYVTASPRGVSRELNVLYLKLNNSQERARFR
jgi:hypothetical protein